MKLKRVLNIILCVCMLVCCLRIINDRDRIISEINLRFFNYDDYGTTKEIVEQQHQLYPKNHIDYSIYLKYKNPVYFECMLDVVFYTFTDSYMYDVSDFSKYGCVNINKMYDLNVEPGHPCRQIRLVFSSRSFRDTLKIAEKLMRRPDVYRVEPVVLMYID